MTSISNKKVYIIAEIGVNHNGSLKRAKEMIKNRLCLNNKIMSKELLTPERKEALLDLAKGSNLRDQEWALKTIALLTCQGVEFNDIQVSNVSPRKD